ncbi:hypothetical protein DMENIID0001_153930 [Sergentomyia squamirostris]
MSLLLVLLVVLLVTFLFQHLWMKRDLYKLSWHLSGPFVIPILGNLHFLLSLSNEDLFNSMRTFFRNYKTPARFWIGSSLFVCVTKPEDVQVILNSMECIDRYSSDHLSKNVPARGLLTLRGHQWKVHRKLLNPTFNLKTLQSYMPIFNNQINVLVSRLSGVNSAISTDIHDYTSPLALDSICQTAMGSELNIQRHQNVEYFDALNNIISIQVQKVSNPILHIHWLFKMTSIYENEMKSNRIFSNFIKNILKEKKANFKHHPTPYDDVIPFSKPKPVIDHLMNLFMVENKFTAQDVFAESRTIVHTGFETTALVSSYCVLAMAMFPENQQRIYEEIKSIIPNKDGDIQYEDLKKFEFLERFIKECLRLFPPIPLLGRVVRDTIKLGDYTIPKETNLILPIWIMHRDKEAWGPTAEEFDPNRFLPENYKHIHPYAYIPFTAGPRNCIGYKYAQIFLTVLLIKLVNNFKFRTDLKMEDLRFRMDISLKLQNKHMVYIEKRDV